LFQKDVNIVVHFNEFEPNKKKQQKFEQLKKSCSEFMDKDSSLSNKVKINYYNEDFETLFPKLLPNIKKYPSFVNKKATNILEFLIKMTNLVRSN